MFRNANPVEVLGTPCDRCGSAVATTKSSDGDDLCEPCKAAVDASDRDYDLIREVPACAALCPVVDGPYPPCGKTGSTTECPEDSSGCPSC